MHKGQKDIFRIYILNHTKNDFVLIQIYQNLLTLIFMSDETKRITEEKSEEKKLYGLI